MKLSRRALLVGAGATVTADAAQAATGSLSVTVLPQPSGMTATITLSATAPNGSPTAGVYTFSEAGGANQTVTTLDSYVDPQGAFTQTRKRVVHSLWPGMHVDFCRMTDGSWAAVEMWYGQVGLTGQNFGAGYSVTVAGDFAGSGTTPYHWCNAGWRLSGNSTNGLRAGRNDWPYAYTPYATLIANKLIPDFASLTGAAQTTDGYAVAYTPMGSSSWNTDMGRSGELPDLNTFNGWEGDLLSALSPAASSAQIAAIPNLLASVLAVSEAAASMTMHGYDPAHGCNYEGMVNNPSGPGLSVAPPTQMDIVISGPPGNYGPINDSVYHGTAQVAGVGGGQNLYYMPNTWTIPAGGSVQVTLSPTAGGLSVPPTGAPTMFIPHPENAVGCTYAWADLQYFRLGSPWVLEQAHWPETAYAAYVLWRDPFYLISVQDNAALWINPGYATGGIVQVRATAWTYRSAAFGCAATDMLTTVPAWLLPKSTMNAMLGVMQTQAMRAVNGTTEASTVFHVMEAIGGSGSYCVDHNGCDSTPCWDGGNWCNPWQNAYYAQSAAFRAMNKPSDANGVAIATYILRGIDDRWNGTSGWPVTANPQEHMALRNTSSSPYFTSYADAWAQTSHYYLIPHYPALAPGQTTWPNAGQSFPGHITGTALTIEGAITKYETGGNASFMSQTWAPPQIVYGPGIPGSPNNTTPGTVTLTGGSGTSWTVSQSLSVPNGSTIQVLDPTCYLGTLPSAVVITADSSSYILHDWMALSFGVQAGLTQFRSSRNYIYALSNLGTWCVNTRALKQT